MYRRDYKPFAAENYYHVYNRGNNKQTVFLEPADYDFFIIRLAEALGRGAPSAGDKRYIRKELPPGAFSLICYCLMPNHFHFLLRQNSSLPVSILIQKICTSYSMYFNKKYHHLGHVWQDQFKAALINDDSYLLWLSAYIHLNPVAAGLAEQSEDYVWSSFNNFMDAASGLACENGIVINQFKSAADYKNFVQGSYDGMVKRKDLLQYLID